MKRIGTALLGLAVLTGVLAVPASAKKVAAVPTTLYMHGNMPVGDGLELVNGVQNSTNMKMDAVEPAAGAPKSMSYSFAGGNEQCAGNDLFPAWSGMVSGKLASDVKMTAHFAGAPSTVTARIWLDVPFGSCTSSTTGAADYREPNAQVEVTIPAGHNEVVFDFPGLKGAKVGAMMVVQLHTKTPTSQGRILYDSADMATHIEFDCVPAKGSTSCTS